MSVPVRKQIRFILNDRPISLDDIAPDFTLLDFLRIDQRLTGTKEGCAEGDCGACTVLVGRLGTDGLVYETVNACIRFVGSLDACHVVTIEHLAAADGALHPVQQAMVDRHGSQCGFCTPGIVMSLYDLWLETNDATPAAIEKALQGNLCRCTGYETIIEAAKAASAVASDDDRLVAGRAVMEARLSELRDGARVEVETGKGTIFVPASVDDFADILQANPEATIVAGSTDVGLWVTKQFRSITPVVFINNLVELKQISEMAEGLTLGAGVSYSDAFEAITGRYPTMRDFWERIGGEQVRNMGTVGGNIANGSPIGDTPPPLIALSAQVTLRKGASERTVPLEDFFIDYGKQDRQPGEFVSAVHIPAFDKSRKFAAYKISKRRDEDISAVCGAFNVKLESGRVADMRIAFGGMAATPKRASAVEAALLNQPWSEETILAAMEKFADDYQPLTDWRATADYRLLVASNLLKRFFMETQGEKVRVERFEMAGA